ncbi:Ig-like domain-containing protein [Candidatus Saccharibacteria bacterium]|nr:Ig-like domain-containing protein [Candidatus Saccharibacteria bacterium]
MIKRKLSSLPLIIPILTLITGSIPALPTYASSANYYLGNPDVSLDGTNPTTVDIPFNTVIENSFASFQGDWSLHETNDSNNYFTLSALTPASNSINPLENSADTGHIVWNGNFSDYINADANSPVWTATYNVAADTPSGSYTISFTAGDIASQDNNNYETDSEVQDHTYTATVNVQNAADAAPRINIIPVIDGVNVTYQYTGSQITPSFNVYADNEKQTLLTEGTDYTVEYGENTNLGTGTITLSEVPTSAFSFSGYNHNFNIVPRELTAANVSVPSSITYTGSTLTPTVVVTANNNILTEGTDYTVAYSGQDGNIGSNITIVVNGQGNYTGVVDNITVPIVAKPTQSLAFAESTVTKSYGDDNFTNEANLTIGNGSISYSSSNEEVATVDPGTGEVTIISAGETTITATAAETETYSEASASYTLTVEKITLTSGNVDLSQNIFRYDGTAKEPSVTINYEGRTIPSTDYSVSYSNNTEVGNNATVTITPTNPNYTSTPINITFSIVNKDILNITGVPNGQSMYYTGAPVVIEGTLNVGENDDNITPADLTTTWYDENDNIINQPTNVGNYKVSYSYNGENYIGELTVTFSIVKANSGSPDEYAANLRGIEGDTLATIPLTTPGLSWVDPSTDLQKGENIYPANYIRNNDSENYESSLTLIPVYGRAHISVTTSVEGNTGGTISDSIADIIEDDTTTITFTPEEGYEINQVLVDGNPVNVNGNSYVLTAGSEDMTVSVSYKLKQYTVTITGNNFETDADSTITVDYNGSEEIAISAKHGYRITSILVNGVERIGDLNNGVLTISNITSDTTIVVTTEKITYDVTSGAGQSYSITKGGDATFTIDADYSLFENGGAVYVDGNLVDPSDYTSHSGSTVIVLSSAYLSTLANGTHTLSVLFNDGGTATTTFTITDQVETPSTDTSTDSSDTTSTTTSNPFTNDNIYISFALLGISFVALLGSVIYLHRKNQR